MPPTPDALPSPPHYDPSNAERWWHAANAAQLYPSAREWASRHGVAPAAQDTESTLLLLVDVQRDFCLPEGSLYVGGRSGRGAIEDSRRLAGFIYRNLDRITSTVATLDSHLPQQIFFPSFWVDHAGQPAQAHRVVTVDDVATGKLIPRPELASWMADGDAGWLRDHAEFYCRQLEESGRYALYLWPPHCLLGSPGHALAGVVEEARLFHAFCRSAEAAVEVKGAGLLSEHYSVLGPEVLLARDGGVLGEANERLVRRLLEADRVVVAGQAASHCVRSTLEDLWVLAEERDPSALERIYVLADCMSAVAVRGDAGEWIADFTDEAAAVLERCRGAGMQIVHSDMPMEDWA